MGNLVFITGGVRSGKSRFAVELAMKTGGRVLFVATCVPGDDEMRARVAAHRKARPAEWTTVEECADVGAAIAGTAGRFDTVVVDCLTLFVSGLLAAGESDGSITGKVDKIAAAAAASPARVVVVSNEVGSGVVPVSGLGRRFRDVAGAANQALARAAQEAYLMVSGLAVPLKGRA